MIVSRRRWRVRIKGAIGEKPVETFVTADFPLGDCVLKPADKLAMRSRCHRLIGHPGDFRMTPFG
jgi:hypothetical protein